MQTTTTPEPAPGLRTLVETLHDELAFLRRRQYALEATLEEIERVTKGKTFDIHNGIRWIQMLDWRDKNVIDLASWARAGYSGGGFLGKMQADHLRAFVPVRPGERHQLFDEQFAQARERLFPGSTGRKLKPEDFATLRDAFSKRSEALLLDRHENRAHIYEKNSSGKAKMLDLKETGEYFDYFEQVLKDIAHVAMNIGFSTHDMNRPSSKADAQDVTDQLLLTHQARRNIESGAIDREVLYETLHAMPHDDGGKPAFNGSRAIYDALVKHGLARAVSD